jgi:hypothetical protein
MFSQSFSSQLCKTHLWCQLLMEVSPDKVDEEHLLVHVTAGGAAGALASAVTTPLDVVKTRLQCQVHRPGGSDPKDFRGQFLGWNLSLSNFSSSETTFWRGKDSKSIIASSVYIAVPLPLQCKQQLIDIMNFLLISHGEKSAQSMQSVCLIEPPDQENCTLHCQRSLSFE